MSPRNRLYFRVGKFKWINLSLYGLSFSLIISLVAPPFWETTRHAGGGISRPEGKRKKISGKQFDPCSLLNTFYLTLYMSVGNPLCIFPRTFARPDNFPPYVEHSLQLLKRTFKTDITRTPDPKWSTAILYTLTVDHFILYIGGCWWWKGECPASCKKRRIVITCIMTNHRIDCCTYFQSENNHNHVCRVRNIFLIKLRVELSW